MIELLLIRISAIAIVAAVIFLMAPDLLGRRKP